MNPTTESKSYEGWGKFQDIDAQYFQFLDGLLASHPDPIDLIHQFPAYVGSVNLGRFLFLYEMYKKVRNLAGHVGELGVYKGATFLFLAKLIRLFETHSTTQAHGFDWFKGMVDNKAESPQTGTRYVGDYEQLKGLIEAQHLQDVAILHRLDLITQSQPFLQQHPHLRFKLLFIDCGLPQALSAALTHFWPRLVRGGILVMDHYNLECASSESDLVDKIVGTNRIRKLPFNRQPTAYVVKKRG